MTKIVCIRENWEGYIFSEFDENHIFLKRPAPEPLRQKDQEVFVSIGETINKMAVFAEDINNWPMLLSSQIHSIRGWEASLHE